jgi:hypothetical protein
MLQIKSENDLYEFIKTQMARDFQYSALFEFVHFEYLSVGSIGDFGDLISNSFNIVTVGIWKAVSPRLLMSTPRLKVFPRDDDLFDGVFSYLIKECGGNIHDQGIVKFSASSKNNSGYMIQSVVDFNTSIGCYGTNSWMCFNFQRSRIISSHYSIRSRTDCYCDYPRLWVIEGSDDGETWSEMDSRRNIEELRGLRQEKCYMIPDPQKVRMIRIRQT